MQSMADFLAYYPIFESFQLDHQYPGGNINSKLLLGANNLVAFAAFPMVVCAESFR